MDVTRTDHAEPPPDRPDRSDRFEALFHQHYEELTRFAARRVGPDSAADVVAATFLTAWRRFDDLPDEHPRAWLFAIARHVIGNELRSGRRRDRLTERTSQTHRQEPDHAPAVIEHLAIRTALAQLSELDQEILQLTAWEGLGIDEVAQVLGCTRTAAKVRLHRARRRLAARLAATAATQPTTKNTDDHQPLLPERNVAS